MTEKELTAALRPHMPRIIEAVKSGKVPPNGNGKHGAAAVMLDTEEPQPGEFRPADAPQVRQWFGADDNGHYPARLHVYFGMNPRDFARASGLRQMATPNGWVWVE